MSDKDIITYNELILALKKLNPEVEIFRPDQNYSTVNDMIFSATPGNKLKLPKDFYYNEKNGITNKHNKAVYMSLHVLDLAAKQKMEKDISIILVTPPKKGIGQALKKAKAALLSKGKKISNNVGKSR
jgi:hypothetical protein